MKTTVAALAVMLTLEACEQRKTQEGPRIATQQSAAQEAMKEGLTKGLRTAVGIDGPAPQGPVDPASGLTQDRPFPENGMAEIAFPIADDQPLSQVTAFNSSTDNMILLWFYNFGKGDKEAARLYIRAGQSARMVLPTYEYRLAAYTAPANLGIDRGFGASAELRDFGFVDMKTPTNRLAEAATFRYYGYGRGIYKPGVLPPR